MTLGFCRFGWGVCGTGTAAGVVVPIADQLHFGAGVAGPHVIPENVTLVSFYVLAAITELQWSGVADNDHIAPVFGGDRVTGPANPATRRVAADQSVADLGANVSQIYISGAPGTICRVLKTKAGA